MTLWECIAKLPLNFYVETGRFRPEEDTYDFMADDRKDRHWSRHYRYEAFERHLTRWLVQATLVS